MEIHKAKEIVQALAAGINPTTGELFPSDSPYNDPQVIRALFTVLGSVRTPVRSTRKSIEEKQKENIAKRKPKNAGLPWSEELKTELVSMFKRSIPIREMALHFERTEGAIIAELVHQGLISESEKSKFR